MDSKIRQGIDGIYENLTPVPDFVIDETKYGTSMLNQTQKGLQMGEIWIKDKVLRLEKRGIITLELLDKITEAIETGSIDRIVSHISANGEVKTKKMKNREVESIHSKTSDFTFEDWP